MFKKWLIIINIDTLLWICDIDFKHKILKLDGFLYFVFNGINGDTGTYDVPKLTPDEFAAVIQGTASPENLRELRYYYESRTSAHFGVREGVDSNKLDEAG